MLQAGSFGGTYFRPIYSSVTKKHYDDQVWEKRKRKEIREQIGGQEQDEKVQEEQEAEKEYESSAISACRFGRSFHPTGLKGSTSASRSASK